MVKKLASIILLLIVSFIVFWSWFNFSYFTFSDWYFMFSESIPSLLTPSVWISGLGGVDFLLWRYPFHLFYGLFGFLGYDSNITEKFALLWPTAILPLTFSYLLLYKITKSHIGSILGAFIFAFNSYFLSIATQGHILLITGFAFANLALFFLIQYFDSKKIYYLLLCVITLFVVGANDLRSLYITMMIVGLYFAYMFVLNWKKSIFYICNRIAIFALFLLILLLLNFYWILPMLAVQSLTSNPELGRIISYSRFYQIYHAITLHFPFWTGGVPRWESYVGVQWYFWLYPLLAFIGLLFRRKNTTLLFFALVTLLGFLLSKQTHLPFNDLYHVLYEKLPGFNAFREASKFYYLISLGYAVLIGSLVSYIWRKKDEYKFRYLSYLAIAGITLLSLWNTKPLITGEIGTLFKAKQLPNDFIIAKEFIFNQDEYFRTFWIHPSNRWSLYTAQHPMLDAEYVFKDFWDEKIVHQFHINSREGEIVMNNLKSEITDKLLDAATVKYVMIQYDEPGTNDYIDRAMGMPAEYFRQELLSIPYLQKLELGTKQIEVYENLDYKPHIYLTAEPESIEKNVAFKKISFQQISPSEFNVTLKQIKQPVYLHLTDMHNTQWAVRAGKFNWFTSLITQDYFQSEKYHGENVAGMNTFFINPDIVCAAPKKCLVEKDGSYSFDLTLFFKPQASMNLGIRISLMTLVSILSVIFYIIVKEKRRHGKTN